MEAKASRLTYAGRYDAEHVVVELRVHYPSTTYIKYPPGKDH